MSDFELRSEKNLSLAAYALSGQPMPQYTRATMPGRLLALEDDE